MSAAVVPDDVIPPTSQPDNQTTAVGPPRNAKGQIIGGGKGSGSLNPGGRPKKLRAIEFMLNTEHRNLQNMREVFQRLRALALGETILVPHVSADGTSVMLQAAIKADPGFMKLYLNRILGPEKQLDDSIDLSDAPPELIEYLRSKVGI